MPVGFDDGSYAAGSVSGESDISGHPYERHIGYTNALYDRSTRQETVFSVFYGLIVFK